MTATEEPVWFSRSSDDSSLPVLVSRTWSVLSQPETKVRSPTTAGVPITGPPGTLNSQTFLPSFVRQYSVSSAAPKSTLAPAKLAEEVISELVSNFQRTSPLAASRQKNTPSTLPTNTEPSRTAGATLTGPSLTFHFCSPVAKSTA